MGGGYKHLNFCSSLLRKYWSKLIFPPWYTTSLLLKGGVWECMPLGDARIKQGLRKQQVFLRPLLVTAKKSKFCKSNWPNAAEGLSLLLIVSTYKRIRGLIRNKDQEINQRFSRETLVCIILELFNYLNSYHFRVACSPECDPNYHFYS